MPLTTVATSGAAAGSGRYGGDELEHQHEHHQFPAKTWMQAVAAIHGFDALVGPEGKRRLFLNPQGFKGCTLGQASGFGAAAGVLLHESDPLPPLLPLRRGCVQFRSGRGFGRAMR